MMASRPAAAGEPGSAMPFQRSAPSPAGVAAGAGTSSAGGFAGLGELRRSRRPRQPWPERIERIASMFHVRWVLAGLLILPIAELAVFLAIASEIGVLAALSVVLATSLAGAAVIRGAGRAARSRLRACVDASTLDAGIPGLFTLLAGILLLVPGFLTDVAGALLLVPALQRRILATLLRSFGDACSKAARVVELDPDEWRRVAEEETGQDPKRVTLAHSCPPAPPVLATPPESGSSASRVKEEQ